MGSIAGYDLLDHLHAGPRSRVWRARRPSQVGTVILKVSTPDELYAEAFARHRREYQLLHHVISGGVVEALELTRDGNLAVLVLKDSGGDSLHTHLQRDSPSLVEVLGLALNVVGALCDVHAAGIVHCDVNPHNVVYNASTEVLKLVDFDNALRLRPELGRVGAGVGTGVGTLSYIAPEQTGRMNRQVDFRSDLYSVGVTLYEAFADRRPFDFEDPAELVHAHIALEPVPLVQVNPEVPATLSRIVMKLLAKAPEERYQTAAGLEHDLKKCLRQLNGAGRVQPFELATQDATTSFTLPDRFIGRETEVQELADAFERVANGGVEVVLVQGPAGVGKSTLVAELQAPTARSRGYFVSGKFDQLRRNVPYSALISAFEGLVEQLLTESEASIQAWRSRILDAVEPNAGLVVDLVPGLKLVVGPQSLPPEVDPGAGKRRLMLTLQRFVQVFSRRAHPLVLFLDDVQWADSASLNLLTQIAASGSTEALLLVEALRDTKQGRSDFADLAFAEQGERCPKTMSMRVEPFGPENTVRFVAEALRRSEEDVRVLGSLILAKTQGNPFFLRQFLHSLDLKGEIRFDAELGVFELDPSAVRDAPSTDNVAALLADTLRRLPSVTRRTLMVAAALGSPFDLGELVVASRGDIEHVVGSLQPALDAGVVIELPVRDGKARYAFQHDQVQQAAYQELPIERRAQLHLEIGREILGGSSDQSIEAERLYDVVRHFNIASSVNVDPTERAAVARLNTRAGDRARDAAAYDVGVTCFRAVTELRTWTEDYEQSLEAHRKLAECLSLAGDTEQALATIESCMQHVRRDAHRAQLEAIRVSAHISRGQMVEAVECTRRVARQLGVELPVGPLQLQQAKEQEIRTVLARIEGGPIERLLDLPEMVEPDKLAVATLLMSSIPAVYQTDIQLFFLVCAKLVTLTMEHGSSPASAIAFSALTAALHDLGDDDSAYDFGRLGLELVRKRGDHALEPNTLFLFGALAAPWRRPLDECVEQLRRAYTLGLERGDYLHMSYGGAYASVYALQAGLRLAEVEEFARGYREACRELGEHVASRLLGWIVAFSDGLRGPDGAPWMLVAPGQTEADVLDAVYAEKNLSQVFAFLQLQLERSYLMGDYGEAVRIAESAEPLRPALTAFLTTASHTFYGALSRAAVTRAGSSHAGEVAARLEQDAESLARWTTGCPQTFVCQRALLLAERARILEDVGEAMDRYDEAIRSAGDAGMLRVEAIANELAGRFWHGHAKAELARAYLRTACGLYRHWGALRLAEQIEGQFGVLVSDRVGGPTSRHASTTGTATHSLDFEAVVKAARVISGEVMLDRLLAVMTEIVVETTGAQRGAIVLDQEGTWMVRAISQPDGLHVSVLSNEALDSTHTIPSGAVRLVLRTGESLVVDDARLHGALAHDAYVEANNTKSVLCAPIRHKSRVLGAMYVENNLVAGAFTADRLQAIDILASQVAVSIENARLFEMEKRQGLALTRMNEDLEELVATRTQELRQTNERLRAESNARAKAEVELRLTQKLQAVGQLAAGVAHEINTPMQYVGDNLHFLRGAWDDLLSFAGRVAELREGAEPSSFTQRVREEEQAVDLDFLREGGSVAIENALQGVERVSRIVSALKAFSHPDQAEMSLEDINVVIDNTLVVACNEYKLVANVERDLQEGLPLLRCHGGEIRQVLLNLIVNAAHAIQDVVDGTLELGTITVRSRLERGALVVQVVDTGAGIPEECRDQIFDPFFTTKEVGRGTGQGLALARSAVERHGGEILFDTEVGRGTAFTLRLPLEHATG